MQLLLGIKYLKCAVFTQSISMLVKMDFFVLKKALIVFAAGVELFTY